MLLGCVPRELETTPPVTDAQSRPATSISPTSETTPTARPTQTATLTPPPTLEPVEARDVIRNFLREPVDCPAPCLWGIVPGQTTLGEAKNILTRLGLELKQREVDYELDSRLSIKLILTVQNDWIVESLRFHIRPEEQRVGVPREWSAYSPDTMINRYGLPSKVDFKLDRGAPDASYTMDLHFDAINLTVEYFSYDVGEGLQVCPLTDQFETVRIWVGTNPQNPPNAGVPLEQSTSLTIAEFAALMTGDAGTPCFGLTEEAF